MRKAVPPLNSALKHATAQRGVVILGLRFRRGRNGTWCQRGCAIARFIERGRDPRGRKPRDVITATKPIKPDITGGAFAINPGLSRDNAHAAPFIKRDRYPSCFSRVYTRCETFRKTLGRTRACFPANLRNSPRTPRSSFRSKIDSRNSRYCCSINEIRILMPARSDTRVIS